MLIPATTMEDDGQSGRIGHVTDLDTLCNASHPVDIGLQNVQTPFFDHLFEREPGIEVFPASQRDPIHRLTYLLVTVDNLWNQVFLYPL